MREDVLFKSDVPLTGVVQASGAGVEILTVGDALRFMKQAFTNEQMRAKDWRQAATALSRAAATATIIDRANATKEFIRFLRARGMLLAHHFRS